MRLKFVAKRDPNDKFKFMRISVVNADTGETVVEGVLSAQLTLDANGSSGTVTLVDFDLDVEADVVVERQGLP